MYSLVFNFCRMKSIETQESNAHANVYKDQSDLIQLNLIPFFSVCLDSFLDSFVGLVQFVILLIKTTWLI